MMIEKTKKKTVIVLVALAVTIVIVAIAFSGWIEKEIKVGAILPLTGEFSDYGEYIKKGIDLAVEEINDKGGIEGRRVIVHYKDNEGKSDKTISAMNDLAGEVPVVIGAMASSNTLAICPIAEEKKIVLISPTSTSPKLSDYKNYVFRTVPSDKYQGIALARTALNLNYKRLSVLYIEDEYGIGLKDEFAKSYREEGGDILTIETFKEGDTDFKPVLARIKEKNPEAIVLIGYEREGAAIVKQAKELGLNVTWVGSDGVKSDAFIDRAGDDAEGLVATYPISMVSEPVTEKFVELYEARYGAGEIDSDVAYGYDTMKVVAEAIEKGEYTSDGIRDALREVRYSGVSGAKVFDENGDVPPAYDLWEVENSQWVLKSKFVI